MGLFDLRDHVTAAPYADVARGLRQGHRDALGTGGDGRGGSVASAHPLLQHLPGQGGSQGGASLHNHAVSLDDEGAVKLGDFLDRVGEGVVENVSFPFGVPAKRIDATRLAESLHFPMVANDKDGAHGFALPALVGELQGDAQHLFEHRPANVLGQSGLADGLKQFVFLSDAHGDQRVDASAGKAADEHEDVAGLEQSLGEGDERGDLDLSHAGQLKRRDQEGVDAGAFGAIEFCGVATAQDEFGGLIDGAPQDVEVVDGGGVGKQHAGLYRFRDLDGGVNDGCVKVGRRFRHPRLTPCQSSRRRDNGLSRSRLRGRAVGNILIGMGRHKRMGVGPTNLEISLGVRIKPMRPHHSPRTIRFPTQTAFEGLLRPKPTGTPSGRFLALAVLILMNIASRGAGRPARASDLKEPEIPTIQAAHRAFLSRVARRTVRDRILKRPVYEPSYVPDELAAIETEVLVRLRRDGFLLATAASGPSPMVTATRDAALAAGELLGTLPDADLDLVNALLIEIEVVGPPQEIPWKGDWTSPRAVDSYVEPGVHGLVLIGSRVQHRFTPTELFTNDLVLSEALERLAQQSHATPGDIAEVRLMRFRTLHWYEDAHDNVVTLHRGLTVLPPASVSPAALDAATERLADYMLYRQLASGLFTYQFEPGRDRYSDQQNAVRQAGAVAAMAFYALKSGRNEAIAAADRGIEWHRNRMRALADVEDAAFIATDDGEHKLGVTALLCLAMAEHPEASRFADERRNLTRAMLALQHGSGMFLTAFPPGIQIKAQEYFPGEALLALARQHAWEPSAQILDAFHQAHLFYRAYFRNQPSPPLVSWHVQAFAAMAQSSGRRDYADYVFELTDWLAAHQLTREHCPWPELWGGVAAYADGRAGVATAAYLEAFADALTLARKLDDPDRAARYERVVRDAARFVLQLQIRPEEAYFMRSPRDAVGGIRASPSLNVLRIDHCQHALVGLLKARDVLYPASN